MSDSPDVMIRVRLIESRQSSRDATRLINERLAPDRQRSESTVCSYLYGRSHPDADWIAAAESVLGFARGELLDAFASRRSPLSAVRTAAHRLPGR